MCRWTAVRKLRLATVLDLSALCAVLLICLHGVLVPTDELVLHELATAGCFWIALRTVVLYGCGGQLWPAPAAMFLIATLVSSHIGAFFHYASPVTVPQIGALRLIWGLNLAYLSIALGTFLYVKLHGLNTAELVSQFYERPASVPASSRPLLLPSMVILAVGIGMSLVLTKGSVPILHSMVLLLHGQFAELRLFGIASRNLGSSMGEYRFQGYLNQMRAAIMPMISMLMLCYAQRTRDRLYRLAAVFAIGASCIMLVSTLERGTVFLYFLQLLVLGMLLSRPKIAIRSIVYGLVGFFVLSLALTLLLGRGASRSIGEAAMTAAKSGIVRRIFLVSSEGHARTMAVFPEVMPFRYGSTVKDDLIALLPGQKVLLSREMFVHFFGGTTSGSASIHSVVELWVNAGYFGIFAGSLLFGLIFQWVSVKIMTTRHKTPLILSLWAMVVFILSLWGVGSLTAPFHRGLIAVVLLYAILRGFEKIQSRAYFSRAPQPPSPAESAVVVQG
jgi:hypothetical protein